MAKNDEFGWPIDSRYGDTRSNRVKEQQKLWQQSGTLHRIRMNLLILAEDTSLMFSGTERLKVLDAVEVINKAIDTNRQAFATIKTRISNE